MLIMCEIMGISCLYLYRPVIINVFFPVSWVVVVGDTFNKTATLKNNHSISLVFTCLFVFYTKMKLKQTWDQFRIDQ